MDLGLEIFTIIGPMIGVLAAIFPIRLLYLEKEYDKLEDNFKEKKENADKSLTDEIAEKNPNKSDVLNFANIIASFKHLESDVRHWAASNRKKVLFDIVTIAIMFVLGAVGLLDSEYSQQYFITVVPIAIVMILLSVFNFLLDLKNIHNLKAKK